MDHPPIVQVSLDVPTIDDALPIAAAAVAAGVDWLEVGTPLILGEGLHAVRALRRKWPSHPVVADLKTMDAGYLECEMMARAGATHVVVMALAHPATVAGAVEVGKRYGVKVMADLMLCDDKPAAARRMAALGVDYLVLHTGYDERRAEPGKSPLADLPGVRAAVQLPIQAVGGLSVEQAVTAAKSGAPLVVVGAPVVIDPDALKPAAPFEELTNRLRRIVREVKGG
ncbi:MAG TPA: orotidine 5'-phosphate decarboxylase / HUMPS family protein [Limnochordia bacterium]